MARKKGFEARAYRNAGTYDVPDWTEVTSLKDLTLPQERAEEDGTTRAAAKAEFKEYIYTLIDVGLDFEMPWDPEDTALQAFRDAFVPGGTNAIELMFLDGDEAVAGSQGLRATFAVAKFERQEPLEGEMIAAISIKPTPSDHAPEWVTRSGE